MSSHASKDAKMEEDQSPPSNNDSQSVIAQSETVESIDNNNDDVNSITDVIITGGSEQLDAATEAKEYMQQQTDSNQNSSDGDGHLNRKRKIVESPSDHQIMIDSFGYPKWSDCDGREQLDTPELQSATEPQDQKNDDSRFGGYQAFNYFYSYPFYVDENREYLQDDGKIEGDVEKDYDHEKAKVEEGNGKANDDHHDGDESDVLSDVGSSSDNEHHDKHEESAKESDGWVVVPTDVTEINKEMANNIIKQPAVEKNATANEKNVANEGADGGEVQGDVVGYLTGKLGKILHF